MRNWKYHSKSWNLPNEGEYGIVENQANGQILMLPNDDTKVLMSKSTPCNCRNWLRSAADESGWVKLTNMQTGKLLTAPRANVLTTTGTYQMVSM